MIIYIYTSIACVISKTFFIFQPKSQILLRSKSCVVFISKVFILIQLLSTANAMDINTDYYNRNRILTSRYHGFVA